MSAARRTLTLKLARGVLGVGPNADQAAIRRAFREGAKRLHPDRSGGDAAKFREMLEAYRLLQDTGAASPIRFPPVVARPAAAEPAAEKPLIVTLTPVEAMMGGNPEAALPDGRRVRLTLPAGLRAGAKVRVDGHLFEVALKADGDMIVRGDDLWMTAKLATEVLEQGGRIALETPLGRRIVWITRKAAERRLLRLEGQGLPARGGHRQGHLFLRLGPETTESRARTLLRKFAAAWAA